MTPHILLLTGFNGGRYLVTIQAIVSIEPIDDGCILYTITGERMDCQESFNSVIAALGGLVMRPLR